MGGTVAVGVACTEDDVIGRMLAVGVAIERGAGETFGGGWLSA